MRTVRRILDLDPETDARIAALAARKRQDPAAVVAEAVELLDSVIDIDGPAVE
jgi:predicted transcriptional regulator